MKKTSTPFVRMRVLMLVIVLLSVSWKTSGQYITVYFNYGTVFGDYPVTYGIVADQESNLYVTAYGGHSVWKIAAGTKIATRIAGTGTASVNSAPGYPAIYTHINSPYGVAVDPTGNVYFSEIGNNRIQKVEKATGILRTVAGAGTVPGFNGDGGLATNAVFYQPHAIALASNGDIYVADRGNNRIRKITAATGIITTVAGIGPGGGSDGGFAGDGGLATSASLNRPSGVAVDAVGNIYIADAANNRIRKVDATTKIITTVAGNGNATFSGDGGPAAAAGISWPWNVTCDVAGNLYIPEGNRIRYVDAATGIITTIAGDGTTSSRDQENFPAVNASLYGPSGVALAPDGSFYILDRFHYVVRKVDKRLNVSQTITFNPIPVQCGLPSSYRLNATSSSGLPVSYSSSNPNVATIYNNQISLSGTGTAIITATQAGDATYAPAPSVTQEIRVSNGPAATITQGTATASCGQYSMVLTAGPANTGYTFLWSNASTEPAITVTTSGTYSVTVKNQYGCPSALKTVTVTVPSPLRPKILSSNNLCTDGFVKLTALGGGNDVTGYRWSTGATSTSINVYNPGSYSVKANYAGGCSSTSSLARLIEACTPTQPPCSSPPCQEERVAQNGIYPNPADTELTVEIQSKAEINLPVTLYSPLGTSVRSTHVKKGESKTTIDTHDLTNGIYIIYVQGRAGKLLQQKVMITHKK